MRIPDPLLLWFLAILLLGCAKAKTDRHTQPLEEKPKLIQVNTGPGELIHYTQGATRDRTWSVRWETATLEYVENGEKGGDMKNVQGELFKRDQVASDYSADQGHADRRTGNLEISGNVRIRAKKPEAVVTCDKLTWDPTKQVVIASGHVKINETGYTLQGVSELWCSPDLKQVATPDLYKKP